MTKTLAAGRFFEDFTIGQLIEHATPRTLDDGAQALYLSLYGGRFGPQSSKVFAQNMGFSDRPMDDWLVFHTIFGKSVPDISVNAIANLGYAEGRFLAPVYAGDTLRAVSTVLGMRENKNGESGIVYVRTEGFNQMDACVLSYCRWVMVNKRDKGATIAAEHVPELALYVPATDLVPPPVDFQKFSAVESGNATYFEDYICGEVIDHLDGVTLEDAEHMLATRLYQNNARVHFDGLAQAASRFGKRIIYGGHVISHIRAMSFNGFANAFSIAALNAGRHVAPVFHGDTIYCASEVLDKVVFDARPDVGALRLRQRAFKNVSFQDVKEDDPSNLILDLDIWVWMPKR